MKIAIISINMYSKGLNFACPLHTYAFQQFLLENGIETTVLNYTPVYYDNFDLRHPSDYYAMKYDSLVRKTDISEEEKASVEERLAAHKKKRDSWLPIYQEREKRYDKFQNFIEKYYVKTDTVYDSDLLEVMDPGFDCYICATDVIWKNQPNTGYDRGYFLASTAMENKWKIAYSASRGVYFAKNKSEDELFFHYLDDIDYLSVREESLKNYIEENTGRKASVVLDPVLLHEKAFYEKIAVKPQEEHYLLLYYVMEKATDTLEQSVNYARAHNMQIVEITDLPRKNGRLKKYNFDSIYRYDIGIEEWLGYFLYADIIFTNSFHACCFSILFEKNFFAGFRHGDKVTNVLKTFNLLNRRIDSETDLISHKPEDIDYSVVRETLKQKRAQSADFILSAIHELEGREKNKRDYDTFKKAQTYRILYNSSRKGKNVSASYKETEGTLKRLDSGTIEFAPNNHTGINDGTTHLLKNHFHLKNCQFTGWRLRLRIDNRWFWYLEDGSLKLKDEYRYDVDAPIRLFKETEQIPYIPVNHIAVMVADAGWKETWSRQIYNYINHHMDKRLKKLIKKILRMH